MMFLVSLALLVSAAVVSSSSSSDSSSSSSVRKADYLHYKEVGPPHCNSAHAASKYTEPIAMWLSTDGGDQGAAFKALHNPKYFKESYSLNGKAIAKPPIAWPNSVKAAGFHASARLATLTATSPTDLAYYYEVRVASLSSESTTHRVSHDIAVVLNIAIDYNCHVLTLAVDFVVGQAALDSAPLAALLVSNDNPCGKGEAHVNGTCSPLTCDSPLACPDNACRRTPVNATTGIAFKCGCDKGYELNGHTLRCEAVTCDAPTACRPYSKCVMLPADTINDCNPTPSMPEQWVRGSKPCRRFECLALP